MKQRDILSEIKTTIEQVAPGSEVILFGSVARGDEQEDSDIDILIIVNKDDMGWREKDRIKEPLIDLEIRSGISIGPIVRTRKEWENPPYMSPFIINVLNEGIRL